MKYRSQIFIFSLFCSFPIILILTVQTSAQNIPCLFDQKTLQFAGTPLDQAKCLLRPNKIGGVLGKPLDKLPEPLESLIGKTVEIDRSKLRKYLQKHNLAEDKLGGSLDAPLSAATLPNGTEIFALYFIIHDTSSPYLKDEPFPDEFNTDKNWTGNNLESWLKNPVAHVFVNRLGDSLTTTPFHEPVKKGFGTKFARDFLKNHGRGLQIHIELHQPRRRDPDNSNPQNDLIAPVPGFTDRQYQRLALLYLSAGVRRGTWLIPVYHSAIDAGIKDAHDDPQNFELDKFAGSLKNLLKNVK